MGEKSTFFLGSLWMVGEAVIEFRWMVGRLHQAEAARGGEQRWREGFGGEKQVCIDCVQQEAWLCELSEEEEKEEKWRASPAPSATICLLSTSN